MTFVRPFLAIFCHMYVQLSQNWGSDGHFKVLNSAYLRLVQKWWLKTQIFPFLFFCDFVQKQTFSSFAFFPFFASYINIVYKTEIQTVILRWLTCLYINWFKSYEQNAKNTKTQKMQNWQNWWIHAKTFQVFSSIFMNTPMKHWDTET